MKPTRRSFLFPLFFFILAVSIDQFSKWLVVEYLKPTRSFPIIDGVFRLHYLENRGAAFGIFYGWQGFLIVLTVLITLAVIYLYFHIPGDRRYLYMRIIAILILSGGIGNLIDRVRLGFVIDFLFFELINFPVFNIADSYMVIACISFLLLVLFYYKEDELDFIFNAFSRRSKSNLLKDDVSLESNSDENVVVENTISEENPAETLPKENVTP